MAKNTKETRSDDLASVLSLALNNDLGTKNVRSVYSFDDDDNPSNVTDFISTGCDALDFAISNRKNGGIPVGRITEITGQEQTGKSVLCAAILASTQKKGGIGVYIDTEAAVSQQFFEMLGLDTSKEKLVYVSNNVIEQCFSIIEKVIEKASAQKNKRYVTIILDSIAGTTTEAELEGGYSKEGYGMQKASIINLAMRKLTQMIAKEKVTLVITNQLRQIVGAQAFAEQWSSPGGKAIPYHASVRVRLNNMGKVQLTLEGNKVVVGQKVQAKIAKNRIGPPFRTADYEFHFNSGIDNYGSWLTMLKKYNLIKLSGAKYTIVDKSTGEEISFFSKSFSDIMESNPALKTQIYDDISEKLILVYKKSDFGIDDLKVVSEDGDEIYPTKTNKVERNKVLLQESIADDLDLINDSMQEYIQPDEVSLEDVSMDVFN